MSDYVIGLLTLPALAVACVLAYTICRWLLTLADKAFAGVILHATRADERKLAGVAVVVYGAERVWSIVFGTFGVMFVVGQDNKRNRRAADLLMPRATLTRKVNNGADQ